MILTLHAKVLPVIVRTVPLAMQGHEFATGLFDQLIDGFVDTIERMKRCSMTQPTTRQPDADAVQEIDRGMMGGVVGATDGRPSPGGPAVIGHLFGVVKEITDVHGVFTRACTSCE